MSLGFKRLVLAELRRQWNLTTIVVLGVLALIASAISMAPLFRTKVIDATNLFMQVFGFLVPVATAVLSTGIIANDVRDGWLRTLLIRPITRQAYFLAKLLSTFCAVWAAILVTGGIPFLVRLYTTNLPVEFAFWKLAAALVLMFGQSLTYLAILALFSCWLPGLVNVALFAAWGMLAQYLTFVVRMKYWDAAWAEILKDYFFPSGFTDAIEAVILYGFSPYASLLWGLAELTGFFALGLWSVNKIQIDKTAELA